MMVGCAISTTDRLREGSDVRMPRDAALARRLPCRKVARLAMFMRAFTMLWPTYFIMFSAVRMICHGETVP
jgi:hypothetical protein